MTSKQKMLVGALVTFIGGCALGMAIGGYQGFRLGTSLLINEGLSKDAREVEARIAVLRQLRAGKQDEAIERLETGLADTLVRFDPAEPYAGLEAPTVAAVRKAIDEARAYRSAHPRQQRTFRDEMVEKLFARDLYK